MITAEKITGLILAGGRAQRMGGIDKGLIPFLEKPLIQSTIERLQPQVGGILINANRNITKYATYGYPVLMDETPDFSGPLAGFMVGLKACKTRYLLTAPCDSPLLPVDLANKMGQEMESKTLELVYASSKDLTGKVWTQPVFCLMRADVLPSLETFLANGDLKIDRWFHHLRSGTVVFEDGNAFANVNTPEELKHLESIQS
jgi:molybdopterin-guanine dinucleotide biosynthesis protein A